MLSNQLLRRAKIPRLIASHALLAGHQQVEIVVDHNRHLDAINRGEHTPILRQQPSPANADLAWHRAADRRGAGTIASPDVTATLLLLLDRGRRHVSRADRRRDLCLLLRDCDDRVQSTG
jgi:hypothetical protein